MATNNSWNNNVIAANSGITLNSGTNDFNISTDNVVTTLNIGTSGTKLISIGNASSTSTLALNCGGLGSLDILSNGATLSIAAGTGAIRIGQDSGDSTVSIGAGDGISSKNVQIGAGGGDSKLEMFYGSLGFLLTGGSPGVNVIVGSVSGELNYPSQPCFLTYLSAAQSNITGDGTLYTIPCDTVVFDQGSNYDNTTYTFTAPVTGRYEFKGGVYFTGIGTGYVNVYIYTSNRNFNTYLMNNGAAISGQICLNTNVIVDMDASDTATFRIIGAGTTKSMGVNGGSVAAGTWFGGNLLC